MINNMFYYIKEGTAEICLPSLLLIINNAILLQHQTGN